MKVSLLGMWHLGTVIAGCLAEVGFTVVALDGDRSLVDNLQSGMLPVAEPGLAELIAKGRANSKLTFSCELKDIKDSDVLWITFDTPVDDEDRANLAPVENAIFEALPHLKDGALLLISSQVPVGFTRRMSEQFKQRYSERQAYFACSPENLRLGNAVQCFTEAERVIVGAICDRAFTLSAAVFAPFQRTLIRMRPESAEMTKHALNAYLATSIAFINEVASVCERVGADAREVESGLKSDVRIGERSPLSPGGAFAGGTLARDLQYLVEVSTLTQCNTPVLAAVRESNEAHKRWAVTRLKRELGGELAGKVIAVLGLTYKPGTDTLRRSAALELCRWLANSGSKVQVHDPAVSVLPPDAAAVLSLKPNAKEALAGADAAVVATAWPEYKVLTADDLLSTMNSAVILDPAGVLGRLQGEKGIRYAAVGAP